MANEKFKPVSDKRVDAAIQVMREVIHYYRIYNSLTHYESLHIAISHLESYKEANKKK